jgi:serine/threonine-protein kinase
MAEPTLKELFEGRLIERRYRLVKLLSEGNFGGVFHARLEIFDEPVRDVAVKITKNAHLNKEDAKTVFGEAILLAQTYDRIPDAVARGYIVPVYDLGLLEEHDRRGFIVMGLIHGTGSTPQCVRPAETLAVEIGKFRRGMAPEVAIDFFRQICTGMAALHDLKVVHRDLKPDNILLTDRGQIRIVDFGLAAGLNDAGYAGGHVGTHRYMAPETFLRGESAPASDIYSMGIILHEMLTGEYPFERIVPPPGMTQDERAQWIIDHKRRVHVKPPSDRNRQVKPWLDALVRDCLVFRPEDGRPKHARQLIERIEAGPRGSAAQLRTGLAEADKLLDLGWRRWFGAKADWAAAAEVLEKTARRYGGVRDGAWFDVMVKLLICYINLNSPSKAQAALSQVEPEINKGKFLASYQERTEFYEGLAKSVEEKPGMKYWAIEFEQKAGEARRKGRH